MDALTYKVKVKDVLFFATLAMISLALHAILLFGFNISLGARKDRPEERKLMKVGFVKRQRPAAPVQAPRKLQSPKPNPEVKKRPSMKKDQLVPPAPIPEKGAKEEEVIPEAFSQFLEDLDNVEQVADFEFQGDSYDVLEGGRPIAGSKEGRVEGAHGVSDSTLDSRVQMVVNSYPATSIERTYSFVQYPDLKVKKKDYQKGWMSVYFEIDVDNRGRIEELELIRPRIPNELEQLFVDAVIETIRAWRFDRKKTEIHVDVRFFVE
jgi:outer membrane biosynthesis protein TonB